MSKVAFVVKYDVCAAITRFTLYQKSLNKHFDIFAVFSRFSKVFRTRRKQSLSSMILILLIVIMHEKFQAVYIAIEQTYGELQDLSYTRRICRHLQ